MVVINMTEVISVAQFREINFGFDKRLYMGCCVRKERNGIGGVWKLKGKGRKTS
jgi:hypothetical protein